MGRRRVSGVAWAAARISAGRAGPFVVSSRAVYAAAAALEAEQLSKNASERQVVCFWTLL